SVSPLDGTDHLDARVAHPQWRRRIEATVNVLGGGISHSAGHESGHVLAYQALSFGRVVESIAKVRHRIEGELGDTVDIGLATRHVVDDVDGVRSHRRMVS